MSDEYQPNEVVESQPEPEAIPAELAPEEQPTTSGATPNAETTRLDDASAVAPTRDAQASDVVVVEGSIEAPREVKFDFAESPGPVVGETGASKPAPSLLNIAEISESRRANGQGIGGTLKRLGTNSKGRGWLAAFVVLLLLVMFLFLPPISLAQRLGNGGGYVRLDAETATVTHPDGLTIGRDPDLTGSLRVKLGSVPRADFVAGSVPEELEAAVSDLPTYLVPKSPYYTIDLRTKDPVGGEMTVVIPNEAEPWETLDLYTWDGEAWRWLPTQLDRDAEMLRSTVSVLPASVMVMQSQAEAQVVAEVDQWPVETVDAAIGEIDVPGILIGTMGGTTGHVDDLPPADAGGSAVIVPIVRNWLPGRDPNWALVSDMVNAPADRASHVANLVALAQQGGYPGVVVDYRGVQAQDREAFAAFARELGEAFDTAGLGAAMVVDSPVRTADGVWDTGGYDLAAIGDAVDQVRVVMPLEPSAYAPGGDAEQLVVWAATQVDRHKLLPIYSTLSTDGTTAMGFDGVLDTVGQISVAQTLTESVEPGARLTFSLGEGAVLETDAATQATRVTVGDQSLWLGTPEWLAARMNLVRRYQLGGTVLRDFFGEGNLDGIGAALAAPETASGALALPEVVWEVTSPNGQEAQTRTQVDRPQFAWTAPEITGTYRIAAMLGSLDKGAMDIVVAAPAPVVTDTLTAGDAETESAETPEEEVEEADATLAARFVSDVSIPDNTRFEKGEEFTKTWRMRNSGSEDWPEDTVLVFTSGADIGKVKEVEVGAVKSGADVDLSVDMVAPGEDGSYRSTWELRTDGKAIKGGAAYVLIQVGEEPVATPTPAAPVAAPRPVASGSFELGGHIRDLGIPYANQMHYAGMNWVKIQVFFGQGASGIINAAHAGGFKIQLSAIGGAGMTAEPGFEDKFAAWVAGLAAAGADAIEVWNEPNIDREWQVGLISPQAYTNLLCKSYNAIKGANGGTAVISAAPAPTGWFGGCGPNGCDDKPWMEGLYNAGAANCMDYIGAHHNAGATSPSARIGHPANPGDTHHSWFFLPQTELYYNIFRGSRKLFYTEMGYASQEGVETFSDQFAWARGTDNSEQAAWLAEAVQLSVNTGMVRCIIVWNIDFVRYGYDPQDGYAIIRPGGGCPACETLHGVLGSR